MYSSVFTYLCTWWSWEKTGREVQTDLGRVLPSRAGRLRRGRVGVCGGAGRL